ncbi:MAG TPA: SLBB domain-containing protein [Candidatus Faecaligallichristensenella faecipullorum]|nr:SLBB domain-containing protein [Candidatus Faecaligallichristensenella faecipullorum]
MEMSKLAEIMKRSGIVGAGGAGFPSYAKLNDKADTIILNCAECEPLLKLHRQVLKNYTFEIMTALTEVAGAVGATNLYIAAKKTYKTTLEALFAQHDSFPNIKIYQLPSVYPAGDEVLTIYGITGRVVPPGSIPISVGVIVYNVETMFNTYYAIKEGKPVTSKFVTVAGEVRHPVTLRVPLGMTHKELIELAGGATVKEYELISGGPMTGKLSGDYDLVTKTTNAILVLPKDHYVIARRKSSVAIDMKRAFAACCQCRMCTDLCPRHLLGHPIEPHAFMRAVSSGVTADVTPYVNSMFCSQCGLCEMYSCFQGLSPKTLLGVCKTELRKNGVPVPKDVKAAPVSPDRDLRRVPMKRLVSRLDLTRYNIPAVLDDRLVEAKKVKLQLSQHIGAPAVACVKLGDKVEAGQVVANAAPGKLSVPVHASISGVVVDVNDKAITLQAE